MATTSKKKWGIWYEPTQSNFKPGWVLDETYSVALYANEKQAKTDARFFVHPDQYEPRPYARTGGSGS
jgi:hypothetical protein